MDQGYQGLQTKWQSKNHGHNCRGCDDDDNDDDNDEDDDGEYYDADGFDGGGVDDEALCEMWGLHKSK